MPEDQEHSKFWLVMRDANNMQATRRHPSYSSARAEAERLCAKDSKRFYVFEAIAFVEPEAPPVKWTSL